MLNETPTGTGQPSVTAVVVTYGSRQEWALATATKALLAGVAHVVVVYNGADGPAAPLQQAVAADAAGRLALLVTGQNNGSAGGYAAGLEAALETPATHLWLLDDDTQPRPDTLVHLLAGSLSRFGGVIAYRRDRRTQRRLVEGVAVDRVIPRPGSFMYFDLADRLARKSVAAVPASPELPYAPYGGLLVRADVVRQVGLPRADLVLYEDDTEWTARIATAFGPIRLCPTAILDEVEASFAAAPGGSGPRRLLQNASDGRTYYATRNRAAFDQSRAHHHVLRYRINRTVYLSVLTAGALRWGRTRRLQLIRAAVADGEHGRLGACASHPLSQL